ncbi:MAG: OmpA family protein [Bryobacteraceae bacterium]|jgi:outer membrane protein OmpA-like peptidoglycan-associated protein
MKAAALFFAALATLCAQVPNPTQQPAQTPVETGQPMPIFRVTVVSRTISAINYHHRSGTTQIDFRGTELMPPARGEARVESQMGSTKIDVHVNRLTPANQFGPEYLTYVLWAITPEGRAQNLGELALSGDHSSLLATSSLQVFGLIVTAEPYFAVTQPSDVVVMENFVRNDTTGTIEHVEAKYELLKRGQYVLNRTAYQPVKIKPKGPLQLAEAENAVEIARLAGADRYASDTFQKATIALQNAEDMMGNHGGKPVETNAREAAQMAEDARIITYRKIEEEQLAEERRKHEEQLAQQRAAAEQAQAAAQAADAQRATAEAQRAAAEQAQAQAQAATAQAVQDKAAADAARAAAIQQQQQAEAETERARQAAAQADAQRQEAETERTQLRERLRQQLNAVLETRETARGLIVNINDVLFDFNKFTLKPGAREKMAKVSGILLAYPGLKLQLEGHTDSVGSDDYNLKLSQERADAVRDFLSEQGVPVANISSVGLGKSDPVASNDSAAGRQQNRRVELVVSGEAIGMQSSAGSQ